MASVQWGDFVLNGISLVASPNLLFGYKNILPFGLLVAANGGIDPAYLDDFTTGRVKIYVMTQAEVAEQFALLSSA